MNYQKLLLKKPKTDMNEIDPERLVEVNDFIMRLRVFGRDCPWTCEDSDDTPIFENRDGGGFDGKAIFLNDRKFDWVLGKDEYDMLVLVPLKK